MISSPLLSTMREDYRLGTLEEDSVSQNPYKQFDKWFQDELSWKTVKEPNAMHLATCTKDGKPSGRIVLLKYFDQNGFVFFTNYNSRKSHEMIENPYASITFFWNQRQIRIEGTVEKVTREESENYFKTRPKASQLGAWVSKYQSAEVSREELVESQRRLEKQYESTEVPTPEFWGGWRIKPTCFEFWQGKGGRIHDRIKYKTITNNTINGNSNNIISTSATVEITEDLDKLKIISKANEHHQQEEKENGKDQQVKKDSDDNDEYGKWSIKRLYP
ncbi:pyridoxamine-phosphate oxidase [Cavenderia fasciculata]|uniref:Pyridoxine-5'-phosphate oxidase n=1 Tax=Cavenderia fasciculata TaxID=261658 RepID=F4PL95_CACFS|nr:pyridoxamine-phosphate oxidase [Cavenderia fasciculata]EGG23317.1 pyridoxamine-phosphate oxidase [Cavenderia fasciculata]|eukprot:XP_004361168.1 pyridoxamine-phosphate oxidase [Cavenderia fasciculata]